MPDGLLKGHLYIVLTDPTAKGLVLVATPSTTKKDRYYDKTTILKAGCHEYITDESYIRHDLSDVISTQVIERKLKGRAKRRESMDDEVISRILEGVLASGETLRWVKKWYRDYLDDKMFEAL